MLQATQRVFFDGLQFLEIVHAFILNENRYIFQR